LKHGIFDTETTGLFSNSLIALKHKPHVIEFFAQKGDIDEEGNMTNLEELEFFCKPPIAVSEEITRITGIKPEDVADAPPFKEKADEVFKFFADVEVPVAHNLSYDMAVVNAEFERLGREFVWSRQLLCTVEATEHLRGHRLSLSALHELLFGEPFAGAHRARHDVTATTRCLCELIKRGEI
jgi:DNA polymerase III epsilon subunit-like protein